MSQQPLNDIIGKQLSAVVFVQDYIQLQFDGPTLTAFTLPSVRIGDAEIASGQLTYRDVLCGCISKIVRNAFAIEGEEIRIEFEDGSIISVSLNLEDYQGPEAAMLNNGSDNLWVW